MLDCYPEMSSKQYKTKKSHLVQLMPIFADLVLSNENDLKEHLRLIFIDISSSFAETALISESQSTRSDN